MEVNGLVEEVEALKSIYFRELEVTNDESTNVPTCISINLHPATAENTQEQYVCLTLVITLPVNYPNELPEIVIRNPRGLSDEDFERIKTDLLTKASESQGNAMLYELIEIAKEHLTMGNTPRCSCAICLYGFTDDDVFTKTGCYHYFHSHCLARYIECVTDTPVTSNPLTVQTPGEDVKVLCPVCREPITYDLEMLKAPPPLQSEGATPFKLDSELVKLQQQMSELFDKQKSQGGIIDVEAEKNKYLLEISSVPTELDNGVSEAFVRPEAKPANQKPSKKEPQRSGRKPAAQEQDEPQQDRKPQRDSRKSQPSDTSSSTANGGQADRQNHNHNRGRGGSYRSNRWQEDGPGGRYPSRNNRGGRGHPEPRYPHNERYQQQHLNSSPRNSTEVQGPPNYAGNGYRRPNYGQRGRGDGRRRDEQQHPRSRPAVADETAVVNGGTAPPCTPKMDWAEQVGEEDSPSPPMMQPRNDSAHRGRGYNRGHRGQHRAEHSPQEDGAGPPANRDAYRKRSNNNNYRNYRRWNQPPASEKVATAPQSADTTLRGSKAAGPDKSGGGNSSSESIPVSRFMVLTGPPTMAFADSSINGIGDAVGRGRRPPPGFTQTQNTTGDVDIVKTFAASLPPGFKMRPESVTAAPPPGFEAKM